MVSEPITSAFLDVPAITRLDPTVRPYKNTQQAATRSKPQAPLAPMPCCTRQAVEGNRWSGVTVQTRIASISVASTPRCASARRAASIAMSEVAISGPAMWRSRIPVCSMIHSSLVSISFSRS